MVNHTKGDEDCALPTVRDEVRVGTDDAKKYIGHAQAEDRGEQWRVTISETKADKYHAQPGERWWRVSTDDVKGDKVTHKLNNERGGELVLKTLKGNRPRTSWSARDEVETQY